eukprot:gene17517-23078_t
MKLGYSSFTETTSFLARSALVGTATGISVVLFKTSIAFVSTLLYEDLANILPKPVFYWPLALYPIIGSIIVAAISYLSGPSIRNGADFIAQTIDNNNPTILAKQLVNKAPKFDPLSFVYRILAAITTLGSGCSLGPEGPAVEIGTGLSRLISYRNSKSTLTTITKEKHQLFLCGASAAVSAGFNAPITGVFFAIECGNRYLQKNTIKLDESSPDGPRADIAAIVLAASIANLIVKVGLHEQEALAVQGNIYALNSPIFELSLYVGLGLLSGAISVVFTKLREIFADLYNGSSNWSKSLPFTNIPYYLRPILAGVACGLVSIYFPQTLFVGYATLDQLLAGLKIILSSFSLSSGLVGGVFAPSLFFGATIASAPAYATVGAAATLGSLFRAPLTSSMLMFELTQNHDIVLPVLLSTGLGGLFAELISHPRKQW